MNKVTLNMHVEAHNLVSNNAQRVMAPVFKHESELSVIVAATWNVGLRTWRAYWGQRTSDEGRSKMRRKQPHIGTPVSLSVLSEHVVTL